MAEAQEILTLMGPFLSYLSPILILLTTIAFGDHLVLFVQGLVRERKMRY